MIELVIASSISVFVVALYLYFKRRDSDTKKIPFSDTLSSSKLTQNNKD